MEIPIESPTVPREKFLGFTDDGEIVFANYRFDTSDKFFASFDVVRPIREEDYNLKQEYEDHWSREDFDAETYLGFCEKLDCAPSEVPHRMMEVNEVNGYGDIRDIFDCSLFEESIELNGDTWCFESDACGQHDPFTSSDFVWFEGSYTQLARDFVAFWTENHFKTPEQEVLDAYEVMFKCMERLPDKDDERTLEIIGKHIDEHSYVNGDYKGYMCAEQQRESLRASGRDAQRASEQLSREQTNADSVRQADISSR